MNQGNARLIQVKCKVCNKKARLLEVLQNSGLQEEALEYEENLKRLKSGGALAGSKMPPKVSSLIQPKLSFNKANSAKSTKLMVDSESPLKTTLENVPSELPGKPGDFKTTQQQGSSFEIEIEPRPPVLRNGIMEDSDSAQNSGPENRNPKSQNLTINF